MLLKIFGIRGVRYKLAGLPRLIGIEPLGGRGRGAGTDVKVTVRVSMGCGVQIAGIAQLPLPDIVETGDAVGHV